MKWPIVRLKGFDKGIVYGPFRTAKMASKLKEISWENPAPITTWSMMLFLAQGY